jgi:hypothetical protein
MPVPTNKKLYEEVKEKFIKNIQIIVPTALDY